MTAEEIILSEPLLENLTPRQFDGILSVMDKYATEQIKKDRDRIVEMQQPYDCYLGIEYAVPVEDIEKLPTTLD